MNPELKRHLWLECSVHRLVAMPCVLALIFFLVAFSTASEADGRVVSTGLLLFVALTVGWGAQRVSTAVTEEWRDKTWDGQRMSALGPWAMTWGKLLGSTAFAWYGGLLCLGVMLAAWPREWPYPAGIMITCVVGGAVGVQALALLTSLLAARKGLRRTRWRGIVLIPLLLIFTGLSNTVFSLFTQSVVWWDSPYATLPFVLGSTLLWAVWAVFGAYRLMCQELQVRTTPWAWAMFVLCLAWYLTGFVVPPYQGARFVVFLLVGFLVSGLLTYLALFTEQTGIMVIRRVWIRLQRQEWHQVFAELPCWPVSLLMTVACATLLLIKPLSTPLRALEGLQAFRLLPLLLLVFLVRDAAIFLGFSFTQMPRRVEATTVFYLALLYLILPAVGRLVGGQAVAALVLPPVFTQPVFAAGVLAVHTLMALSFMAYRWRQSFQTAGL